MYLTILKCIYSNQLLKTIYPPKKFLVKKLSAINFQNMTAVIAKKIQAKKFPAINFPDSLKTYQFCRQ